MKWLREPKASETLGAFRIALGVLTLVEALWTLPSIYELYGMNGFLQADLMSFISGWSVPNTGAFFESLGGQYNWVVLLVTIFHITACLFFISGIGYRSWAFVLWLTNTFYMNSGHLSVYGVNRYLHLFAFLAMFLPLADSYTLRTPKGHFLQEKSPEVALWVLRIALAVTYLHAGISKSSGVDWWTGDAIWRAVTLPEFQQHDLTALGQYPWIFKGAAMSTLFFETFYALAIFIRPIRTPWILVIISMHLGISLFMGLHFFALAMTTFNVMLYFWPQLQRHIKGFSPSRMQVAPV